MSWFRKKSKEERGIGSLNFSSYESYTSSKALLLACVYRCVEVISDSVAQLPLEVYTMDNNGYKKKYTQHSTYWLLNKEPNNRMSRHTFLKTMIVSMLLKGNAYAYIDRDLRGNAVGLYFIPDECVTINVPSNIKDPVTYTVRGIGNVEACNMIHVLNFTTDGIHGISTLKYACLTLGLANDAEAHARGFFKGGANLAGILKVNTPLTSKQKSDLKESWHTAFSPTTGTPNGVAVLEGNMDFTPITVNPAEAQLLETRKFNVIDICRFFGVNPVKCFDLSHSSYSTVEATQLSFLTDTLSPLLEKIELEFERKLYKPSERNYIDVRFDTATLLRADKKSLAEYYRILFNVGAITSNEVRKELDLEPIEGGDNPFVQSNMITLDNASKTIANNTKNDKKNNK